MVALIVSTLALGVSIATAWVTLFRRGMLHMTQPMLVGFLYDLPEQEPKVFLRTMLYTTGKRGYIVEALYLKVRCGESMQLFSFWMYGETKALMIGSGLRVGEDGVSSNHHFLPPKDAVSFAFIAGEYVIDVYAQIVNRRSPVLLSTVKLSLAQDLAVALHDPIKGVLFVWDPQSQCYRGHISSGPLV
jgi:hypothetical protein